MYRAVPMACLALALLAPAARADEANRYEVVVVPVSAATSGDKTEALLLDRQTGRIWLRMTEFDPATFAPKATYWVPEEFRVAPGREEGKSFLPPN